MRRCIGSVRTMVLGIVVLGMSALPGWTGGQEAEVNDGPDRFWFHYQDDEDFRAARANLESLLVSLGAIEPLPLEPIPDPPPYEGAITNLPYIVEPPDILFIEVLEALPGRPIQGERLVRPDGTINLGFYGELDVKGLTLEQVKIKLILHLREFLEDDFLGLIRENPAAWEASDSPSAVLDLPPSPDFEQGFEDLLELEEAHQPSPHQGTVDATESPRDEPRQGSRPRRRGRRPSDDVPRSTRDAERRFDRERPPSPRRSDEPRRRGRSERSPRASDRTAEPTSPGASGGRRPAFRPASQPSDAFDTPFPPPPPTATGVRQAPSAPATSLVVTPGDTVRITIEIQSVREPESAPPPDAPPETAETPIPAPSYYWEPVPPAESNMVFVDVVAYNSKYYYVQGDVGLPGRLAITGNETVLDALQFSAGLTATANRKDIRLVRPARGHQPTRTYKVDLDAILEGDITANYQLFPGDRIIVGRHPVVEQTIELDRLAAPIFTAYNLMQTYSFTLRSMAFAAKDADLTPDQRDALMKHMVEYLIQHALGSEGATLDEDSFREGVLPRPDPSSSPPSDDDAGAADAP